MEQETPGRNPHPLEIKDEDGGEPKTRTIFPSLIWGGEGGGGKFSICLIQEEQTPIPQSCQSMPINRN